MQAVRIVLFATAAAIIYGILHDLVTAHLCVEYFTIAHPPLFATDTPWLLALGWGVVATWWVGLLLGAGLAAAARLGSRPPLDLKHLARPVVLLMLASAAIALIAGAIGAFAFKAVGTPLLEEWAELIPPDRHLAFAAVASAHMASYAAALIGGLYLIGRTARLRFRNG
ncbi:MAG TPA: hypothetical protein VLG14_17720 [Sphingomonas sp.]|nr:hypothetical protein [Sphingomonas sp.]